MSALAITSNPPFCGPVGRPSDVRKTSQARANIMGTWSKSLGGSPKTESASVEARRLLIQIAGPVSLGDSVKAVLGRVARVTGLGDRRVRAIWNEEARAIRSEEMDRLRAAAAAQEQAHAITAGRAEAVVLADVFSRVLGGDAEPHPHLASEEIAALRHLVDRLGLGDRAGARSR